MKRRISKTFSASMAVVMTAVLCCSCGNAGTAESESAISVEAITNEAGDSSATQETGNAQKTEDTQGIKVIDTDVTKEYSNQTDSEGRVLVSGAYDTIALDDDCQKTYPKLANSLSNLSDLHKNAVESSTLSMKNDATAYSSDGEGESALQRSYTYVDSLVERADSSVVCIQDKVDIYSGGAHDNISYNSYFFNPQTGAELTLGDIVNDTEMLSSLLGERIRNSYSSDIFIVDDIDSAIKEMIEKNISAASDEFMSSDVLDSSGMAVVLGYDNIKFIFAPYSLAYFAAGTQSVTLYFDEYPDLVKPQYMQAAGDYIMPVDKGELYRLPALDSSSSYISASGSSVSNVSAVSNISSDGSSVSNISATGSSTAVIGTSGGDLSEISIPDGYFGYYYMENSDGDIEKVDLYLGNNVTVMDDYITGVQPYLVRSNGKIYIYVATRGMDDYSGIHVYGVENGTLKDLGSVDQGFKSGSPTNPAKFSLEKYTDILGTYGVYSIYHIGEDGMPATDDEYVYIQNDDKSRVLTSLKALTLKVEAADDSGNWEEQQLPSGTLMYPFRTDEKSFVDAKLEDGRICRIDGITLSDSGTTIGGENESDVFDGIMYAG